jgi:hypothetical protein
VGEDESRLPSPTKRGPPREDDDDRRRPTTTTDDRRRRPTTTKTDDDDDDDGRRYWIRAYEAEEADATRDATSRGELSSMTFDVRRWFSARSFRNQPDNMRDVLPTGLR